MTSLQVGIPGILTEYMPGIQSTLLPDPMEFRGESTRWVHESERQEEAQPAEGGRSAGGGLSGRFAHQCGDSGASSRSSPATDGHHLFSPRTRAAVGVKSGVTGARNNPGYPNAHAAVLPRAAGPRTCPRPAASKLASKSGSPPSPKR